jgi:hypothetical protein
VSMRRPRRVQAFTVALVACLTVLLAASSAYAQPARPAAAAPHAAPAATYTFQTFCLHGTVECLNDTLCNTNNSVQLWNINPGWKCALTVGYAGTVNPAGWPFYCHDGLNVQFAGDPVFDVGIFNDISYSVQSAGYGNPVSLTPTNGSVGYTIQPYLGLWVADHVNSNGTITSAQMVDAFETCNDGSAAYGLYQSAYGGCGGNGCLVREQVVNNQDPPADMLWDWEQFSVNASTAKAGTRQAAMPRLVRSSLPRLPR